MKKFVLILCLACFSVSAFADEVMQPAKNNRPNKFVEFFKETFKTVDTKLNEINTYALNKSLEYIDTMGIQKDGTVYTFEELKAYINKKETQVNVLYDKYINNPNDIKNNVVLIQLLAKEGVNIKEINEAIKNDILDKAYNIYLDMYNQMVQDVFKFDLSLPRNVGNNELVTQIYSKRYTKLEFDKIINSSSLMNYFKLYKNNEALQIDWYNKAKEVSTYSYDYEKQTYEAWAQKNNKKVIANISLAAYVYQPYAPAPEIGYLYVYNPKMDFTLQAFQTVPGGVILTGSYYMVHTPEIDNIFLQTSKQYADGKYILEPIIAEYKGFYEYYTVLGTKKRIYKFYRLGESELKKNFEIPGQPFYFYQPY